LQRDIRKKTKARDQKRAEAFKDIELRKMEVKVIKHKWQRFAVWFGGSQLSSQPQFLGKFHTKAQYEEEGPRIARASRVFSDLAG